jgi:hypothetical protein
METLTKEDIAFLIASLKFIQKARVDCDLSSPMNVKIAELKKKLQG